MKDVLRYLLSADQPHVLPGIYGCVSITAKIGEYRTESIR